AVISLLGARARFPGAEPPEDDHHAPPEHGQTVHIQGEHAVIHETHQEPGAHGGHAPSEPAAAGSRAAEIITTSFLLIAAVLAWIMFWKVGFAHQDERIALFTWIISADLKVD